MDFEGEDLIADRGEIEIPEPEARFLPDLSAIVEHQEEGHGTRRGRIRETTGGTIVMDMSKGKGWKDALAEKKKKKLDKETRGLADAKLVLPKDFDSGDLGGLGTVTVQSGGKGKEKVGLMSKLGFRKKGKEKEEGPGGPSFCAYNVQRLGRYTDYSFSGPS
jgi:hypothetical protein